MSATKNWHTAKAQATTIEFVNQPKDGMQMNGGFMEELMNFAQENRATRLLVVFDYEPAEETP